MSTSSNPSERSRRGFLQQAGILALGSSLGPLLPAEARVAKRLAGKPKPTLIAIYLRGGADALNIVVPYANKTYYDARPTIGIPEKSKEDPVVIKLDQNYGLHPALKALKPFYDRKIFAPLVGTGSPHPTRSHFDAQDFMEYAAPGDRTMKQGWLNRFLAATKSGNDGSKLRGLALQGLLPRSLRGREPVLAVPSLQRRRGEPLLDLFDDVYRKGGGLRGTKGMEGSREGAARVVEVGRETIQVLRRFWDLVEEAPSSKARYPRGRFADRLKLMAKMIKSGAGLEVAALDLTSWDHHQGEGAGDGLISRRLKILGDGLGAFATDLGSQMDQVMVLVMTEFGRTVAENGNRGTDHGHGSVMLALGGPVQGGRVYGDYGSLKPKDINQSRDLHADIDFRTVFSESLEGLFGYTPERGFFPGFDNPRRLGFVRKA